MVHCEPLPMPPAAAGWAPVPGGPKSCVQKLWPRLGPKSVAHYLCDAHTRFMGIRSPVTHRDVSVCRAPQHVRLPPIQLYAPVQEWKGTKKHKCDRDLLDLLDLLDLVTIVFSFFLVYGSFLSS